MRVEPQPGFVAREAMPAAMAPGRANGLAGTFLAGSLVPCSWGLRGVLQDVSLGTSFLWVTLRI